MTQEQKQEILWVPTKAAFIVLAIELALIIVLVGYAWAHKTTLAGR